MWKTEQEEDGMEVANGSGKIVLHKNSGESQIFVFGRPLTGREKGGGGGGGDKWK